jgi:hypothetical protein
MQTVHVRVNDAATGQPTPVRICFAGPQGEHYAPFGRLTTFATDMSVAVGGNVLIGEEPHAYIDGTCEIQLPVDTPITITISKGPEYQPLRSALTLTPGKLALRYELRRWIDLRAEHWYSGDVRSHFLTPHAALLEAAAEDVAVVNLLAWECLVFGKNSRQYPAIPNLLAFSGQHPALESPGHMVVVNTLNRHPTLGQLLLLNCHRVIYPLTFGGPEGFDNWTLADWCDQCHRKAGLVVGDDFFNRYPHGELLADLLLGKIDALMLDGFENPDVDAQLHQEPILKEWYGLLNCGFRIPLVGGSGKDDNLGVLGSPRTYARLEHGQAFDYKNWIEAVRAGRTFVTNGPLLFLSANGQDPGSVIELPAEAATVHVRAEARSLVPLEHLEVVANGQVVGRAEATSSPFCGMIDAEVPMPRGGWLLARCWGPYEDVQEQWTAAQSSPIYVRRAGLSPSIDRAALTTFLGSLDKMLDWVHREGRFANDQQRERLADVFQSARQVLLERDLPKSG